MTSWTAFCRKPATLLIYGCFFLSGTAGLVYEVIWVRMIERLIGGAPYAVASVLAVFMGGLALGSRLSGMWTEKAGSRRMLLGVYGFLELFIGLYALLLPYLVRASIPAYRLIYDRFHGVPYGFQIMAFVGCVVLLIIPTTLMGGTLPVLCRYAVNRLDHLGRRTGFLYGLNTIGAAMGTVLCGFVLIPEIGVTAALYAAASVNLAAGLLCILAAFLTGVRKEEYHAEVSEKPGRALSYSQARTGEPEEHEQEMKRRFVTAALILFAISGFSSMAFQVFWTRLIGLLIGPTHYAFTLVVSVFIVGLALGSVVAGRFSDSPKKAFRLLVLSQGGAAVSALVVSQILGNSPFFFAKLIQSFHGDFKGLVIAQSLILAMLLLVPTFFSGTAFPLTTRITATRARDAGKTVGTAYAVNTVGAIVGSFGAGFVLIPLMGKQNGISLTFFIQAFAVVIGFVLSGIPLKKRSFQTVTAGVLVIVVALAAILFPSWNPSAFSRGWYRDYESLESRLENASWFEAFIKGPEILADLRQSIDVVYHGEDPGGFTTVEKEITSTGQAEYAMFNSGKADASSHGDRSTQTLSGHIPLLFHHGAEKVMVLGLASGMTPGEVLYYPVKQLDILEISGKVADACRTYFGPYNNHCLDDPRTRLILEDGRNHITLTGKTYDVIISEPSNPWMAGLANLYTRDFFMAVKDRLSDQGIFAQWIQSYEMDWDTFALLGRTFASVFKGAVMMKIGPVDYLLMARADGKGLDWDLARANAVYAAKSAHVSLKDGELLAHLVVTEDLPRLFGDGPIHTDDRPHLEYAAPKHLFEGHLDIERKASSLRVIGSKTQDILERRNTNSAMLDFVSFAASVNSPMFRAVDYQTLNAGQKDRYREIVRDFCGRESVPGYGLFADPGLKQECADIQSGRILNHMNNAAVVRASDYYNLALAFTAKGRMNEAMESLNTALEKDPLHRDALLALGLLLSEKGDWPKAQACFFRLAGLAPRSASARLYLGIALARQSCLEDAHVYLSRSIDLDPSNTQALSERGLVRLSLGLFPEAVADFEKALALDPGNVEFHNNMAMALVKTGDLIRASAHLNEALSLNPDNATLRYNLAQIEQRMRKGS